MANRGTLLTISAPSGAGKTSLVKALVEQDPQVCVSISYTTRPKRPLEKDGINYHFVNRQTFRDMLAAGEFLEHAQVFTHFYGTSAKWVEETLNNGLDVILEIDWQGARQVKRLMPEAKSVFIMPPSRQALLDRLQKRAQDNEDVITQRMREAITEMSHYTDAQWLIINDDFDRALADFQSLIIAQRLQLCNQQHRHLRLLNELLNGDQ